MVRPRPSQQSRREARGTTIRPPPVWWNLGRARRLEKSYLVRQLLCFYIRNECSRQRQAR
jgi:hypothetical protein